MHDGRELHATFERVQDLPTDCVHWARGQSCLVVPVVFMSMSKNTTRSQTMLTHTSFAKVLRGVDHHNTSEYRRAVLMPNMQIIGFTMSENEACFGNL